MAKGTKRRRSTKRSRPKPHWERWLIIALLAALLALIGVYLYTLGFEHGYKKGYAHKTIHKPHIEPKEAPKASAKEPIEPQKPEAVAKQEPPAPLPAPKPKAESKRAAPAVAKSAATKRRPRLAIIIDDVSHASQVRALRALGFPINLSFFPPSAEHPHTPKLASTLSHYMVHLPLEAFRFHKEEPYTLRTTSSRAEMARVVGRIRELFPKARYVNNHTGSKFTADEEAVRRLVGVLERYDFRLLDSRTTAKTKVPKVMQDLGRPYLHRDIFLDNEADVAYIQSQLKKAVELAKRRGYAVAIGHPKPATIEALRRSKGILKEVQLVYIEDL